MKKRKIGIMKVAADLRRKAEEQLRGKAHLSSTSPAVLEAARLLHELQVHNIKLEMQFSELQWAVDQAESDKKAVEVLLAQSKVTEQVLINNKVVLEQFNKLLEQRISDGVATMRKQNEMLLTQNRQAAMGEMIGNIAHQWRQPLNTLGLNIQQLPLYYEMGKLDKAFLDEAVKDSMEIIQDMSRTIDDFRNFFKPDKDLVDFEVNGAVNTAVSLVQGSLQSNYIKLDIITQGDMCIRGYPREYSQSLLNIIINARDALMENKIKQPLITVSMFMENTKSVVIITDNAGGIPEQYIGHIFEPYFTTKGSDKGTGIGLYMAKTIIENNMHGRLTVCNNNGGAEFRIEV